MCKMQDVSSKRPNPTFYILPNNILLKTSVHNFYCYMHIVKQIGIAVFFLTIV